MLKIIGVASGTGAQDHDCKDGPVSLKHYLLENKKIDSQHFDIYYPRLDIPNSYDMISELCERTARLTDKLVSNKSPFVVIGGDHSCAIGTWSGVAHALRDKGSIGLIWIDAHMDSHVPTTSPSGAVHGMPVASLLGFGDSRLINIIGSAPKILPQHLCLIGIRSFEQEEADFLNNLGVRIFYMEDILTKGFARVLDEALEIAKNDTVGYGISIDLDAVDPIDAPGVGTPASGGIKGQELLAAFQQLNQDENFIALEIAELNPRKDVQQLTLKLAAQLIDAMQSRNIYV